MTSYLKPLIDYSLGSAKVVDAYHEESYLSVSYTYMMIYQT